MLSYSIFDFLLGLGRQFDATYKSQHYTLNNIYTTLTKYVAERFAEDIILQQLIAIDFSLQHKVKPSSFFYSEIAKDEKFNIITALKLNHHKYRYTALAIDFDWEIFVQTQAIQPSKSILLFEYTGTQLPRLIVTACETTVEDVSV